MWGRGKKAETPTGEPPNVLKSAVREARIEAVSCGQPTNATIASSRYPVTL